MAKLNVGDDQAIELKFRNGGGAKLHLSSGIGATVHINKNSVKRGTTEFWNSQLELIAQNNIFYVYDDEDMPIRIKLGDGKAYLIDMPFLDAEMVAHMGDEVIHITEAEREKWNGKVRCYIDESDAEHLIFTTN